MSEAKNKNGNGGFSIDLDDHSDDYVGFEFKAGDRFLCCIEDTEIKEGKKGPYAETQFAIIAGPLGSKDGRDAAPRVVDGQVKARRLWRNISFSSAAIPMVKEFLRAVGYQGKKTFPTPGCNQEFADAWGEMIFDREVGVKIKMGKNQSGEPRAEVDKFFAITESDQEIIDAVYDAVGTAHEGEWMPPKENDGDSEDVEY